MWGTSLGENIVWGTSDDAQVPVLYNDLGVDDSGSCESLFPPDIAPVLDVPSAATATVTATLGGLLGGL